MKTINDIAFLKTLFRRFCHSSVATKSTLNVLRLLHVEVQHVAPDLLNVHICDDIGAVMELEWRNGRARGTRAMTQDAALFDANERLLTMFMRRFLLKHDQIDRRGLSKKKKEAAA